MTHRLEVRIDRDRCVGSTMCVQHAPEVFGLDELAGPYLMAILVYAIAWSLDRRRIRHATCSW